MKPSPILALHEISLYNTGRISPEKIIAAFAARVAQFERIIADLAAESPKSRAQHHLIVGQRGMGKTMLLARIAAELRTKPELASRFIPLVFAEEQYAVDRLSKFWLNCLDSLADAREATKDTKAVDEIDATVKKLTEAGMRAAKEDQPFADAVYEAFVKAARATGQRPVLLVDNLQLVFERLDQGQQHSLRELLMRPGSPILIGASPSPPPQSQDYGAAFYDHFKVHYLRPLDESEMRELLLHLANAAQRDDVRQRVLLHPARLKVLRQLTGGNPRTTLTLFFLYAEDFAPSVFGDLEGLLDRVTPLYKARFEELTAQQQVITSAIANHWDPVTAATLTTNTGLPAGTISAQLDRLEKTGVIERTELFGESRTGYLVAERFFNIWFLMRSASRRQRREVEFLTRFLENFYEPTDRCRIAQHLMGEDHFSPDRYLWSRAVADSLKHEPQTAEELTRHTELVALREEACEARARLHELIDFKSLPPATLAFDDLRKKLMSLVPSSADITGEEFARAVLGDRAMFMSGERERLAARPCQLSPAELQGIFDAATKTRAADVRRYDEGAVTWFAKRLADGQIRSLHDADDWNRAFLQAEGASCIQLMVRSLPHDFGTQLTNSALDRICTTLQPVPADLASKWYSWGYDLDTKLARYAEAETAYREAIAHDSKYAAPWNALGNLLGEHFQRYSEAETAYREAIARDPMPWVWINLGNLLQYRLARYAEAESAYREAVTRDPKNAGAWHNLGDLLQYHLHRYVEAAIAYREAIANDPESSSTWNNLGNLCTDHLDQFAEAEEAFAKELELDDDIEVPIQNLISLRRDFCGRLEAAPPLIAQLSALKELRGRDLYHLHRGVSAAYEYNWGQACAEFEIALGLAIEGIPDITSIGWMRTSAVLIHLNYGAELIRFVDQHGDTTARLRPWVEALRALQIGDKRALQNIAPEIRTTAEIFYDGIERRLLKLPEKTRRRPIAPPKRAKRQRN